MKNDEAQAFVWRRNYESYQVASWLMAILVSSGWSLFSRLPLDGFIFTAAVSTLMLGLLRLGPALERWEQAHRLRGEGLTLQVLDEKERQRLRTFIQTRHQWLGRGFEWQRRHAQKAWDLLRSDEVPEKDPDVMGATWLHGLEPDNRHDLLQPLEQMAMHTLVIGVPGSGKTRLFDLLVTQAILRSEPVIIIDPKGDRDLAGHARRSCQALGQGQRFMTFHPGFPEQSVKINLLQHFNRSSELASRIAGLMPSGGDNAPFQAFAQKAVDAVVQGHVLTGYKPSLVLIRQNLENGVASLLVKALRVVCTRAVADAEQRVAEALTPAPKQQSETAQKPQVRSDKKSFNTDNIETASPDEAQDDDNLLMEQRARQWVQLYRDKVMTTHPCPDVEGLISLFEHDRAHYSKMIATLLPILGMLTGGAMGRLLSPTPERDLDRLDPASLRQRTDSTRLIRQRQVMYFGLDSLSDPMVGQAIGQLLLADLAAIAGDRYNYEEDDMPPVNLFVDEAAEVLCPQLLTLLNKGRGAGFRLILATQTRADLEARLGSKAAADQVMDNCNHLIALRTQNPQTQKLFTESLTPVGLVSQSRMQAASSSDSLDFHSTQSQRQQQESGELLMPALLGELPNLEFFARLGGGRLLKGRIPILTSPEGEQDSTSSAKASANHGSGSKQTSSEDKANPAQRPWFLQR